MRDRGLLVARLLLPAAGMLLLVGTALAAPQAWQAAQPKGHIATDEELQVAWAEWSVSQHAETYDLGLGANTTCARCKSPRNWDPLNQAASAALDCAACKRVPGAPRPELEGGVPISQNDWLHIGCDICHQPAGDSFWTGISFWDQSTRQYIEIKSVAELCAKCHEGRHGFEVVEEQNASVAHHGWNCTVCHGAHGKPSSCTDCHDPEAARTIEHRRHPSVNCTACHDQGGLSIWLERDENSRHYQTYISRRFAHALTSWPSHNLGRTVNCMRCHHPLGGDQPLVAQTVSCLACHPDGAVWIWCIYFPRDGNPYLDLEAYPSSGVR